jgi:hypothetical protein
MAITTSNSTNVKPLRRLFPRFPKQLCSIITIPYRCEGNLPIGLQEDKTALHVIATVERAEAIAAK